MHYKAMFDNEYVGAWDLPAGRDAVVTIAKVEAKIIKSQRDPVKKPVVYFQGKERPMIFNKTNSKAVAKLYGTDTADWIGKRISLYATTTSAGGEEVECIRVRPQAPAESKPSKSDEAREPGSEG